MEKSLFGRPLNELMKEKLKCTISQFNIPESSGLSDELTDEDIQEQIEWSKKQTRR